MPGSLSTSCGRRQVHYLDGTTASVPMAVVTRLAGRPYGRHARSSAPASADAPASAYSRHRGTCHAARVERSRYARHGNSDLRCYPRAVGHRHRPRCSTQHGRTRITVIGADVDSDKWPSARSAFFEPISMICCANIDAGRLSTTSVAEACEAADVPSSVWALPSNRVPTQRTCPRCSDRYRPLLPTCRAPT